MANDQRVRANFVSGTLSSSLTAGATSMSGAGLANLPVIDSTSHAAVAIENEIVWVTAHTAGATTATILRAQEGTVAASHASGVAWQHGPTAFDMPPIGPWTSWTPTFTNFTLGSGTVSAAYVRIGRTIHYRLHVQLSGSTMGSNPTFTLPVAPSSAYPANFPMHNQFRILDAGTTVFEGTTEYVGASTVTMLAATTDGTYGARNSITSSAPMTWTNGDRFFIHGTYEAAT